MNNLFTILCTILMLTGAMASGQEVQFTGSVKPVVTVGETFQLVYTLNAQGTNFRGPRISGITVLSGPNPSTSSSIRSVNGRTTMSITSTFGYILQAPQPGVFEFPPATITVDGQTYRTEKLRVTVEARTPGASSSQQQPSQQQPSQQVAPSAGNQNVGTDESSDVFLKAYVSDASPHQGEGIIVTYKLFLNTAKVGVSNLNFTKLPTMRGFWSQNMMKDNERFPQYKQTVNGQQYVVAELRKLALYPLTSGRLTIDPLQVQCVLQVPQQRRTRTGDPFFDDFFNNSFFSSSYAQVEKVLASNALTINVKPLPAAGKPADFSGAVGSFRFQSEIDTQQVSTNEPITLRYTISGTGNIQLIEQLNLSFPPDFEVYDPRVVSNYTTTASGVTGSQVFEYLIIPRKAGDFTIKAVPFSYYDLSRKQYVTLTSEAYTIHVEKGSGEGSLMTYTGAGKEEIRYIGSDVRHIVNRPFLLHRQGALFYGSTAYFLLLILPFVLCVVVLLFFRRQVQRRSDMALMKTRKARRIARKRLKRADALLKAGEENAFYEEISQALWGYLSDKYMIPKAELSTDTIRERLQAHQVAGEIIDLFVEVLTDTEFARFAPGDKTLRMEELYQKALSAMTTNQPNAIRDPRYGIRDNNQ